MGFFSKILVTIGLTTTLTLGPNVIKENMVNYFETGKINYKDKTVVISGATSGIGFNAVYHFAKLKAKVIMLCKDEKSCITLRREILQKTKNKEIFCSKINLESLDSISQCAKRLNEKLEKIDILINNAAVMKPSKRKLTDDAFELQIGINHLGHFLLTMLLVDKLKLSPDSRILNVTCDNYKKGKIDFDNFNSNILYDSKSAYANSKLANVLFTKELANRLKDTNIKVFCVRPRKTYTSIHRFENGYGSYTNKLKNFLLSYFKFKPIHSVQNYLYVSLSPDLMNKSFSGKIFSNSIEEPYVLPPDYNSLAKKLWLLSEKWTRLDVYLKEQSLSK